MSQHPTATSVMLVTSPATYRANAFRRAAHRIGLDLLFALDTPVGVANNVRNEIAIDFANPAQATEQLTETARNLAGTPRQIAAIIAIDDRGALIASQASLAMGLPGNAPDAALSARDKYVMRQKLEAGGVPVPGYQAFPATMDPATITPVAGYPCVVKPLLLNGSRGVIRANTPAELIAAFHRIRRIIEAAGFAAEENAILIERFVPGFEVALEGLLTDGQLQTLALFDKPDPLDGPFFEETIYVTPSRLPIDIQVAISKRTAAAAAALGLRHGPVHAELRYDAETGDIWMIELAGRSIGGLCSSVLEFGSGMSLEELILRHSTGMSLETSLHPNEASGVMMIPIPKGGMLRSVQGVDDAKHMPNITDVEITAPLNHLIVPLPEGESYLGFIFARGGSPAIVESSLRVAHECLAFGIDPVLSLHEV